MRIQWLIMVPWLLCSCVSLPTETTLEVLDSSTGATVTHLAKPLELLATEPLGAKQDPFAYLAPFEINRAGKRSLWLWMELPVLADKAAAVARDVHLQCGGNSLALDAKPIDLIALGLSSPPYAAAASWNSVLIAPLSAAQLQALGAVGQIVLQIGAVEVTDTGANFAGAWSGPEVIARFRESLGLH